MVPKYYEGGLNVANKALHNLFFEVGTGTGVPALLAYLGFFWLTWFLHYRSFAYQASWPDWYRFVNLAMFCGIPGYWAASMFSSGALIEAPYVLVAMGIVAHVLLQQEISAATENQNELLEIADLELPVEVAKVAK